MPDEGSLPPNTADWRLDPARGALLIHDMRYFVDFHDRGASPATELVRHVARLRAAADRCCAVVASTRRLLTDLAATAVPAARSACPQPV